MIIEYVAEIAKQMGIKLTRLAVVEGRRLGALDVHLLNIACDHRLVSILVYQSELDILNSGSLYDRLEDKIRSALEQFQLKLKT